MNGEGCFSIYQATKEKNKTCSFSIGQKVDGYFLLIIVKHILKLEKNTVFFDKKTNCYTLKTTSVKGVSSVLKFIHKAPVKLVGSKRIEYFQWAKSIRTNTRYNTVKVPKNLSAIATAHDIVRSFQ